MAAPDPKLARFREERNAALLGLDAFTIYRFARKHGADTVARAYEQRHTTLFWVSVRS